jgi:protein CpxP
MTMPRLALCLSLLSLGAAVGPAALAMPPGPPPDGAMMPPGAVAGETDRLPPYLRGTHLTDVQQDQVFDILHQAAPTLRSREKEARQAQRQLHDLAMSAGYDDAKAKALADAAARAMAEVEALRAAIDNRIYRLLTAEQRKQLAAPRDGDRCGEPPRR